MLAEQNPIIEDAVVTMYEMSAEEAIREQCRAREEYNRIMNTFKANIRSRDEKLEQQAVEICQLTSEKEQLTSEKEQLTSEKEQLTSEINRLKALLEKLQGQE